MQTMHRQQPRLFLSPAEIAQELGISSTTVLRMIHNGELPAIRVSERIYRIPAASFEMFKAGTLKVPDVAPLGPGKRRPRLGRGERLPTSHSSLTARAL
jgi:excisionase family DNA binding protein